MSKRRKYQPKQETSLLTSGPKLDTSRPIALYGRHSRGEQFGNVATTQQTEGQERLAIKLGFSRELHRTFYEDLKGISAYKLPMDERKSMSDLYEAVKREQVGTVLCYLVDRLFRTKNGVEYETFINACEASGVKIVTAAPPMRIYDLSISDDRDAFRRKCEEARRYVEEIVKGRLNAARDELGLMGLWAGHGVPVGYTVDFDETSPTTANFFRMSLMQRL